MKATLTALNSLKSDSAFAFHHFWQGKGRQGFISNNNTFDTLANYYICNDFVDPILNDIDQYFNSGRPQTCQLGKTIWQPNDPPPQALSIYNLMGQLQYSNANQAPGSIDISQLATGFYIFELRQGSVVHRQRVEVVK